jgi:phenylpropionate dioxygenase-like ring-hydroxylating dioxygenase large terminal subunit
MQMTTGTSLFEQMDPQQRLQLLDWTPGKFAFRDVWIGVAFVPEIKPGGIRRTVHSHPVYLWNEHGRIRAAEFRPNAPKHMRSATPITAGTGEFPVEVRYGVAWIWYGNPASADSELIPDVPFIAPDEIVPDYMRGTEYFNCTYELVMENVLDLTHIDFVHRSFAEGEQSDSDTIRFFSTSETVTVIRTVKQKRTPDIQRKFGVTSDYQDATVVTHVYLRSGTTFFHAHNEPGLAMPIMQPMVPEGSNRTRLNWAFGGHDCPNDEYRRTWPTTSPAVAAQDERMLRPQNPRYMQPSGRADLCTRFDAAGLELRARLQALVQRQKHGDYSYLPDYPGPDIAATLGVQRIGPRPQSRVERPA